MKKICLVLVISILLVVTLCACKINNGLTGKDLEKFNTYLTADYDGWTLTVSTTTGDITLRNEFVVDKEAEGTTIEYTLEKLNEISIDGENEFKTTIRGTATVADGKITSLNGQPTDLAVETLENISLNFKADYFENATLNSNLFSADVKNPSGFLGYTIACRDMKLLAGYDDDFEYIKISYTNENGSLVELRYDFD